MSESVPVNSDVKIQHTKYIKIGWSDVVFWYCLSHPSLVPLNNSFKNYSILKVLQSALLRAAKNYILTNQI